MTQQSPSGSTATEVSPLRSLTGAGIAAVLAALLYKLTFSVAATFAAHPTITHSTIVANLGAAVRTLVIGGLTLATGIFAIAALGLIGLALQLVLQGRRTTESPPKS